MSRQLVLSLFPGIDLLGRAFDVQGYCVVRGPDVLWGGDARTFHPPAGVFGGIIGGPPCQCFSRLRHLNPHAGERHGNLIPEYERIVFEAQPSWWLMENVPEAPVPSVPGYVVTSLLLNSRWVGSEQHRVRRFSFGTRDGRALVVDVLLFEAPLVEQAVCAANGAAVPVRYIRDGHGGHRLKSSLRPPAVLAGHGDGPDSRRARGQTSRSPAEMLRLQGFPSDLLDEAPFTLEGKRRVIGNGVCRESGEAIAAAVRRAMEA